MKSYSLDLIPLFNWFEKNKRDLPWRKNKTFYRVWISEIMLQQTQVATVIPYYERFLSAFPSLEILAEADLQDILKLWEGLGYYSRARNMHKAAKALCEMAENPNSYDELIKVSGFGPYTTAAVLSFTYNAAHAVVDGNVKRVIARLFALEDDISSDATKQKIQGIVDKLMPKDMSALFNESIMELGARICTPKLTKCEECPLQKQCVATAKGRVADLPIRAKRKKIPTRKETCMILKSDNTVFIQKRSENEMLGGLWRFPSESLPKAKPTKKMNLVKHTYSHFKLELQANIYEVAKNEIKNIDGLWVEAAKIRNYPFDKASLAIIEQLAEN